MNNIAFLSPLFRVVENVSVKRKVYMKNICALRYNVNIFRKIYIFVLFKGNKTNIHDYVARRRQ
ncbi:hypothetical protein B1B04_05940 [Lysinibacillus sp. KCTC 33748]|nr:hypothetical protein B1B04_05940 [Lysinibacillus sp. KCTC 33748]